MIRYFSRQAIHARNGKKGQALVLFLVVICTVMTLLFVSIVAHNVAASRVACANAIDAIAINAATWEARCLNIIAALNDGITKCMQIILWVCVVWAALAIAAAFGVGIPAFTKYSEYAREIISDCWNAAHMLASWSEKIRDLAPYLVLGETILLAKKLEVVGVLLPVNTKLHLEYGPPINLIDAFQPIFDVLERLNRFRRPDRTLKQIRSYLNNVVNLILGGNNKPIRKLIPAKDFSKLQFVRFVGSTEVQPLPIPFLENNETQRIFEQAQAEPYGGDAESMTWKSRLTKWEEK